MIEIDGSHIEGGGQMIRTALALSAITQKPFRAINIRKGRCTPGLKNQHLYALRALKQLCDAEVTGDELGSEELIFSPKGFYPESITLDMETAASITLFLQAVMPPLIFSDKKTVIRIKGGTDTKWNMPIDYFMQVLVPHLRKYGEIEVMLEKRGYFPKGQGEVKIRINPKKHNKPFQMISQGRLLHIGGVSHASKALMNSDVAERQAKAAKFILGQLDVPARIRTEYCSTESVGSGITLWACFSEHDELDPHCPVILGADALGEKGKRAEFVGQEAAKALLKEIESGAPVDQHLCDQLLLFMTPGSSIKVSAITDHAKSNIYVIEQFLDLKFKVSENQISIGKK